MPLVQFEVKDILWLEEGTQSDGLYYIRNYMMADWAAAMPDAERQQQAQAGRTAAQRLLQALLTTATMLPSMLWHSTYEDAFAAAACISLGTRK